MSHGGGGGGDGGGGVGGGWVSHYLMLALQY